VIGSNKKTRPPIYRAFFFVSEQPRSSQKQKKTEALNTIIQNKKDNNNKMDTINNSILMCTSPSKNNQTYEYYTSSDCSDKLSYISPFRFYTQSSTRFSNDGTFDVKYDVIFSSSVTSRTA
jgi:hypothetical protein